MQNGTAPPPVPRSAIHCPCAAWCPPQSPARLLVTLCELVKVAAIRSLPSDELTSAATSNHPWARVRRVPKTPLPAVEVLAARLENRTAVAKLFPQSALATTPPPGHLNPHPNGCPQSRLREGDRACRSQPAESQCEPKWADLVACPPLRVSLRPVLPSRSSTAAANPIAAQLL